MNYGGRRIFDEIHFSALTSVFDFLRHHKDKDHGPRRGQDARCPKG